MGLVPWNEYEDLAIQESLLSTGALSTWALYALISCSGNSGHLISWTPCIVQFLGFRIFSKES